MGVGLVMMLFWFLYFRADLFCLGVDGWREGGITHTYYFALGTFMLHFEIAMVRMW